jgi:hypothetical protein
MSAWHSRGVHLCLLPAQWWIGNAAEDGKAATVFARLRVPAPDGSGSVDDHGVHAFVVPLRDASGQCLPGVEIQDCGYKVGHLAPANVTHCPRCSRAHRHENDIDPAPGIFPRKCSTAAATAATGTCLWLNMPCAACAGWPERRGQWRHSLHACAGAPREPAGPFCQRRPRW